MNKVIFLAIVAVVSTTHVFDFNQNYSKYFSTKLDLTKSRSFTLDRPGNRFLKDGEPFRYISGTVHYFRVHPDDWRDRLQKLKHAGCNALETYIEWASHEPEPGIYDFEGGLDIFEFMNIAYEEGLLVILRPGPYIDAERDMGGLPYWLLRENPNMRLRSMDSGFIYFVDRWFNILFPQLIPYLYENGGPVIMMQVENEYGSYPSCDFYYTAHLRDLTRDVLGDKLLLFTTDGDATNYVKCGRIADVYVTVDFGTGTNVSEAFGVQRLFEPSGPLVNSEFYPGWLDHWGEPHATRSSQSVAETLDEMLAMNASVNIYVFHGGTSFGLTAGSNTGDRFMACPTSYDYDAPLNEAGDPTEKYYAIRNVTEKYVTLPPGPIPGPSEKYAYGEVSVSLKSRLSDLKGFLDTTVNKWPLSFEELSVFNGIVTYSTKIPYMIPDPSRLSLFDIHDRGYVFVDDELMGIVSRELDFYELPIYAKPNQTLSIVVESQGRVCYGDGINDFKGITTNVTLNEIELSDWEMTPLPLLDTRKLGNAIARHHQRTLRNVQYTRNGGMSIYEGTFNTPFEPNQPQDTFMRLDGWTKGYAWVNGFLLGRYWPVVGPQVTLYVPRGLLRMEGNTLLILELETAPCSSQATCKVTFVDTPQIDGPTPQW